jgi:hypothetical protein
MRRLAKIIDEETEKYPECPEVGCGSEVSSPLDPGFDDDESSVIVHIDQLRAAAKIE